MSEGLISHFFSTASLMPCHGTARLVGISIGLIRLLVLPVAGLKLLIEQVSGCWIRSPFCGSGVGRPGSAISGRVIKALFPRGRDLITSITMLGNAFR